MSGMAKSVARIGARTRAVAAHSLKMGGDRHFGGDRLLHWARSAGVPLWPSFFTPADAPSRRVPRSATTSRPTQPGNPRLFFNSVKYATGSAVFAFWSHAARVMNERTNTPFSNCFRAVIIPLIIPGILFVVAWILLGSPKIGISNLCCRTGSTRHRVHQRLFDVGMIWVPAHYSPCFLLMTATFRSMDPSLEESAMMSGANTSRLHGV